MLGRKYLSQFLETLASQDLIRFWTAVEELRTAQRKNWHQLGAEIFYTFIRNPTSEIKVDKPTKKRMEAFLLGNYKFQLFFLALMSGYKKNQLINSFAWNLPNLPH